MLLSDVILQPSQPASTAFAFGSEIRSFVFRYTPHDRRIAEVEEGVIGHLRVVEHAVENLQLRHGLSIVRLRELLNPGLAFQDFRRDGVGNPAVAFTEQTDEVRSATPNFFQADRQHLAAFRLFFGDAPPQIDFSPRHPTFFAQPTQLWKNPKDEFVPLFLHVTKRGRDKHANRTVLLLVSHGKYTPFQSTQRPETSVTRKCERKSFAGLP